MSRSFVKLTFAVVAVAIAGGSASAAVATLSRGDDPQQALRDVDAHASQSYPVVRASGGDPSAARAIGTTSRGIGVSTVNAADGRCVLFSDANQFCASDEQIRTGTSYSVHNDCARRAGDMSITVIAPSETARAVVTRSDGSAVTMTVADDVAWLDTQVPEGSQPAYTTVVASDAGGNALSEVTLPTDLCPGA